MGVYTLDGQNVWHVRACIRRVVKDFGRNYIEVQVGLLMSSVYTLDL